MQFITILSETLNSAQLRYKVAFADRIDAMFALTGGVTLEGNPIAPAAYPFGLHLVVKDVQVKALGEVMASPPEVYLDVSYQRPKPSDIQNDSGEPEDLYTISADVSTEGIVIPKKNYTYAGTSTQLAEEDIEIYKFLPTIEVTFSCDKMKTIGIAAMAAKVGYVNSGNCYIPREGTFSAEKVLFIGGSGEQTNTSKGAEQASRELKFLIREQSWNKVYRASDNTWTAVQPDIYPSTTFGSLFV